MSIGPTGIVRQCDVVIVGGSAAGLAAAIQLGRQRRSVLVLDTFDARNAPAAHLHSYLGHDNRSPAGFAALCRDEVRAYGVEVLAARALDIQPLSTGATAPEDEPETAADRVGSTKMSFRVTLPGDNSVVARRVVLATGLRDQLPSDIEQLSALWGSSVIHCPFCHGYEVRDQRIVHIATNAVALHPVSLFRQLTSNMTVLLHDEAAFVDAAHVAQLDALQAAGVAVERGAAERLVVDDDGKLSAVQLRDGRLLPADCVAVTPSFEPRIECVRNLNVALDAHPTGLGQVVQVARNGETSIPGIFAAGNLTDPKHQLLQAAAHGSSVGGAISFALAAEDVADAQRPNGQRGDWEARYSGTQAVWSGSPNGALLREAQDLQPGTALDIGAGEGADALWLHERGWQVTASDISQRALDRLAAEAKRRGATVRCLQADANAVGAFDGTFDLVTLLYPAIPRTADDRGVHNVLNAVAVGGTLLVVCHDAAPMRATIDMDKNSHIFDPDAFNHADYFAQKLDADCWQVEQHGARPRPGTTDSDMPHRRTDIILRARRLKSF